MARKSLRLPSSWATEISLQSRYPGGILTPKIGEPSLSAPPAVKGVEAMMHAVAAAASIKIGICAMAHPSVRGACRLAPINSRRRQGQLRQRPAGLPYVAVGRGLKGELAIRQGEAKAGVESLQDCLEKMRAVRYEVLTTEFNISLVQGLAAAGRLAEAFTRIEETIGLVEATAMSLTCRSYCA